MNPRVVAGVLGAITLVLGLLALATPDRTMAMVGFAPSTEANRVLALCEIRAVYGGLFAVLGGFTLWGAIDPAGKRAAVLMAGMLWLGLCVGRSIGISIDGNPGVFGWFFAISEAMVGLGLVWAAVAKLPTPANVGVE
jgi:peptidoglycan/LPS O-acetylase OafA/YrhL